MAAPTSNGTGKRPQAPVITANETGERGMLPDSPVVATPFGPNIRGRYTRVQFNPDAPTELLVEIAAWHTLGGVMTGANHVYSLPVAEAGDNDSLTTAQNTAVVAINAALAEA